MKRPLLLILGVLSILILAGIWVYVLLTGSTTPNEPDQFGEFDFGDTTDTSVTITEEDPDTPVVAVSTDNPLRQLTTDPVAGFTHVRVGTSTPAYAHYVTAGTGHIFSINLETGEETRISATTIPLTKRAALTPNGVHVLVEAGEGANTEFIVGTLSTTTDRLSNFRLAETARIHAITATTENEFLYIVPDGNNSLAKAYNPRTNAVRVLFTIPFRDVAVSWHHTAAGPHLVYPKPASRLEGVVYSYTNGQRSRLPVSGLGLSAVGATDAMLYSTVDTDRILKTNIFDNDQSVPLPFTVLPEKCATAPGDSDTVWCGITLTDYTSDSNLPDAWYRGQVTMQDALWSIRTTSGASTLVADITQSTGQNLDIINPAFSSDTSSFYFQNKIDQTLWLYDLTK